ncbi:MAG: trigger factor [Clostridia bacterium]|nr:trigger factor [Clostridia bacterium]
MKYTFETSEKSQVKIKITLTAKEWEEAQSVAYNKTKGRFSIPGFRKGHAPRNIIEKTYGSGVFFEEAINYAFPKYYYDILDKEPTIEAIDRPELEIDKITEKGISIIAIVPVKPEVKLGEYKGIKFDKIEYNVTDKDIEAEIDRLVKRNAREVSVTDRPAQKGDITVIDYSGSVDGVKFDGGTAEKQTLELGSGQFIPGFEEQVEGMNIGDEKDINVKFPEEYHAENLKGKDAVFAVKLHEIKVKEYPEVNDEFIKEAAGEETVEAFKTSTKAKLQEANDRKAKAEIEDKIIKAIAEKSEVEIPEALIERQIDSLVQDMEYRMMYQGLKLADYLKYTNTSMEDYRNGFKKQAEEQVKVQLVIEKITNLEGIKATEEEIDVKIAEQAVAMNKDAGEFKKSLNERQIAYFENNVIIDKVFEFLTKNNIID